MFEDVGLVFAAFAGLPQPACPLDPPIQHTTAHRLQVCSLSLQQLPVGTVTTTITDRHMTEIGILAEGNALRASVARARPRLGAVWFQGGRSPLLARLALLQTGRLLVGVRLQLAQQMWITHLTAGVTGSSKRTCSAGSKTKHASIDGIAVGV